MILPWFISQVWEWMNFLSISRKPLGIHLTLYKELAPGRSVTSLITWTDHHHFVQIFLFFPPTIKSVCKYVRHNTVCRKWPFWPMAFSCFSTNAEDKPKSRTHPCMLCACWQACSGAHSSPTLPQSRRVSGLSRQSPGRKGLVSKHTQGILKRWLLFSSVFP